MERGALAPVTIIARNTATATMLPGAAPGPWSRRPRGGSATLQPIDVHEEDDRPVDPAVGGAVRSDAHRVPAALVVAHVALPGGHGVDHLAGEVLEIGDVDPGLEVPDRPPDVAADHVQQPLGRGR